MSNRRGCGERRKSEMSLEMSLSLQNNLKQLVSWIAKATEGLP